MTTRSILSAPHEAKSLHEGRATAIVRRMEPQPHPSPMYAYAAAFYRDREYSREPGATFAGHPIDDDLWWFADASGPRSKHRCPHGRVGDVLLFCEIHAFRTDFIPSSDIGKALHYMHLKSQYEGSLDDEWHHYGKWRPASRMPTWAVQLRYAIASIDAIRVAEMTEEQAKACGRRGEEGPDCYSTAIYQFRHEYESLHGDGSWLRDHVWLIGLKGVEA